MMNRQIFDHANQFPLDNPCKVANKLMRQTTIFIIENEDGYLRSTSFFAIFIILLPELYTRAVNENKFKEIEITSHYN